MSVPDAGMAGVAGELQLVVLEQILRQGLPKNLEY